MNRRFFLRSSLALGALALPGSRAFAHFFTAADFRPLRRNVGVFTDQGGTIGWLINGEGVAVVDSQFPESAEALLSGLRERTEQPLALLLNSHHHGDHTAGNGVLRPHVRHIVGHENVPRLQQQAAAGNPNAAAPTVPDTTFAESWSGMVGDETIQARHFGPAHTGGDAVIYFEQANVAHMGDLVFNRRLPFIDRPGGASIAGWIEVLETAADTYPADTLYIFGHSGPEHDITGEKADVLVMRDFLSGLLTFVRQGVKDGKSVEELVAVGHIPGFEAFGTDARGLQRVVQAAYEEVTAE